MNLKMVGRFHGKLKEDEKLLNRENACLAIFARKLISWGKIAAFGINCNATYVKYMAT